MKTIAAFLLGFLVAVSGAFGLTVLYTASLNGNLEGCSEAGRQCAGLATRAAWLRALPEGKAALLVDAGDVLSGAGERARSRAILETYAELGYDAVGVGGRDIVDGVDVLDEYRDRYGLICQNLSFCSVQHCLFFTPEPLILSKAGEKVGLFALTEPRSLAAHPRELRQDAKLVPPELMAESLADQLAEQGAEWVILLYHGPLKAAEALARRARGIDLIIVAGEQKLLPPRRVGDSLVVSPGEEGNRVGILQLSRDGRGRVRFSHRFQLFRHGVDPEDPAVLERIRLLRP